MFVNRERINSQSASRLRKLFSISSSGVPQTRNRCVPGCPAAHKPGPALPGTSRHVGNQTVAFLAMPAPNQACKQVGLANVAWPLVSSHDVEVGLGLSELFLGYDCRPNTKCAQPVVLVAPYRRWCG